MRVDRLLCLHCGGPVKRLGPMGPRKLYCSHSCSQKARLARRPKVHIECARCGTTTLRRFINQRWCGAVCRIANRRAVSTRRSIGGRTRRAILDRYPDCHLCDQPIDLAIRWPHAMSGTVDHVVPVAAGGSNHRANLRAAHWCCNRGKDRAVVAAAQGIKEGSS